MAKSIWKSDYDKDTYHSGERDDVDTQTASIIRDNDESDLHPDNKV